MAFASHPAFPTDGPRVAWFLENYCVHTKAKWMGHPLVVEPWAADALNEIFRTDEHGMRYWRVVLWLLPRKNAKSTISSGIGHYLLSPFDGEGGPEGYSAAWGTEQARVVHETAKTMVDLSPRLADFLRTTRNSILCDQNKGFWKVVSKIAELQQGTNPHFAIIDEYHVHTKPDLFDAFRRGTQARDQPLILIITTEGNDETLPLGVMQDGFRKVPDIVKPMPYLTIAKDHESRYLMIRYGLDPSDDTTDIENPEVVRGCNPALWLDPKRLIREYLHGPGSREKDFRQYHLNQLVPSESAGITADMWDACMVPEIRIPDGAPASTGTDLGFVDDWSGHVAAADVDGRIVLEATGWAPPGNGMELDIRGTVDRRAIELAERLRMRSMAVDKFNAKLLMQDWMSRGWPVQDFPQWDSYLCPASAVFYEAVKLKRIAHNGDPVLREHVLNAVMVDTKRGWRFDKPRDKARKIDVFMAALMAVYGLLGQESNALEEYGIF